MSSSSLLASAQYSAADAEILKREKLYQGFFRAEKITLKHKLFAGGWSNSMTREMLYRGPAVGVLLYDPVGDRVALVEQFRVGALNEPAGPWCLEVVAGMVEEGESPEAVAHRELEEEAGVSGVILEYIGNYLSSPGGCDEKLHMYCGMVDLEGVGGIHGLDEENEDIKVHILTCEEVFAGLYTGRCNNPAALITLQWLQLNRDRLRQQYRQWP